MSRDLAEELRQTLREALHLANIPMTSHRMVLDLAVPSLRKIIQREVVQQTIHPLVHPPEQASPGKRLTAAESEILYLLCNGLSISQMAERLATPTETIRSRRVTLFRKLGTTSPAAAVVVALREGLVRLEELSPEEFT
jgi:two-component system invasion response regulator UvrY